MREQKDIKIDKIIKSKRKTVMMQITQDARLVVRAPKYTPDFIIKIAVQKRSEWVQKNQKKMRERVGRVEKKQFQSNEEFLYLGQKYKLYCLSKEEEGNSKEKFKQDSVLLKKKNQKESLLFDGETFFLMSDVSNPKKEFEDWYKKRASEVIFLRVKELALKYNFSYNKIRITNARTRWGSCSSRKNLNLSWRLIMAPEVVLDYVILHELSHLREQNHGKEFWFLVEKMCPSYKEQKRWLKNNGCILDV